MAGSAPYPDTLLLTAILGVWLLGAPRGGAVLPILVAAILIPYDQRIIVATLDFTMIRILLLFAIVRMIVRGEAGFLRPHALDAALVTLSIVLIVAAMVTYGTLAAFLNRLGSAFDVLGMYFYSRAMLRSWRDLHTTILAGLACLGVFATCMGIEWATGRNLFSLIGGVPEYTVMRDGRLRCQGAFSHPILAGVFGAAWLPIVTTLWWQGRPRQAIVGGAACLVIVMLSASSTPVLGLLLALVGLALWPLRSDLRLIRWAALAALVALHFVREKPVWHLLARINVFGGSTGYHRYLVIDRAIEYFGEWWMFGTPNISHWGIYADDITNQYVATGINGGILATLIFVTVLVFAFRGLGRAVANRGLAQWQRRMAWALGVTLLVHAGVFLAVSYFGQLTFIWYLHLAMIGTLMAITRPASVPASARRHAAHGGRLRGAAAPRGGSDVHKDQPE